MYAIAYREAPAGIKRVRPTDDQADVLDQGAILVLPARQESFFPAVTLEHEDLARLDLRILDLLDGQVDHLGQPLGDVIPADSAEQDQMTGQVIRNHPRRELEE